MGIGAGIFLIVLGAILTVVGLNLHGVGWIVLLAGGAGLALYFYFWNRRRGHRAVVTARRTHGDSQPNGVISSGRADQAQARARHHRLAESPRTAVNSQNLLVPTPDLVARPTSDQDQQGELPWA
jgi:Domain of unknown function (DUF6458)